MADSVCATDEKPVGDFFYGGAGRPVSMTRTVLSCWARRYYFVLALPRNESPVADRCSRKTLHTLCHSPAKQHAKPMELRKAPLSIRSAGVKRQETPARKPMASPKLPGPPAAKERDGLPQVFWARGGGTVRYPTRETGGMGEVPLDRLVQEQRLR